MKHKWVTKQFQNNNKHILSGRYFGHGIVPLKSFATFEAIFYR